MKLVYTSLKLTFLFICLLGCKKQEVNTIPQINYLYSECKLSSFSYRNSTNFTNVKLSVKYNSENLLTDFVTTQLRHFTQNRRLQYENGQLKRVIIPFEEYPEPLPYPAKNALVTEYEYGRYGIEIIHIYKPYEVSSRPETEYFEFEYIDSTKPVGMKYYLNFGTTEDKFILGLKSTFEYDSNGNLSKEFIENPAGLGGSHDSKTITYFYDDKINTIKQLNYIYFVNRSPACVFSTNNLVREKHITTRGEYEINYNLEYDSKNNTIQLPYSFSDVIWDCP
jgi:hypothetical protein